MASSSATIIGVLPPPPGQEANFGNPPNQTASTIALHSVCLTLVTFCVALRLYTRQFINHQLGADDYLCIFAYVLTIAFSSLLLLGNARGLGVHMWDEPAVDLPGALEALTIAEYVYLVLAATVKLSCLFFYRRVFNPSPKMRGFIHGSIAIIILVYTLMFFLTLFECTPIAKNWNALLPGHCLPPKGLPYASGAVNVVSDIVVLILPIPCIWSLNLKLSRKLRITAIFSLGIFVCATSIVRLGMTSILYTDVDATWNLSRIGLWAVIEVNVGVICACFLAFPAFLERYGLSLSPLFSRLLSYASTKRGQKSKGDTSATRNNWPTSKWSGNSRSTNIPMESSEYHKLTETNNVAKVDISTASNVPNEDIEAWPYRPPRQNGGAVQVSF